ncbi:hypothetical protein QNO08_06920 [Arthrobacter sp. zg-Y820]|uniref:hypothetical protein n=1 Tax=unclassified Arthrobacter TaxID=235627 RepID=UPI001E3013EA|nr:MULTISPECIES: hypothetical protein [unclassified Arthrobacter]MCC9197745.1 hypothetical protein [Arthrobacter sp. zg-Y820]MDK1280612.1 hypothetical protein [Arthrobacter sp. zg.Y820]WIB10752.1 hypothetical protein QNO08_06920 [Arthrobacter sp. zg-Y820]
MSSPEAAGSVAGRAGAGTVAALGEPALLQGFRLAGAVLYPAAGPEQVRSAWASLPDSVLAVVLTPAAAAILAAELADSASPLTAVLPDSAPPLTAVLP